MKFIKDDEGNITKKYIDKILTQEEIDIEADVLKSDIMMFDSEKEKRLQDLELLTGSREY